MSQKNGSIWEYVVFFFKLLGMMSQDTKKMSLVTFFVMISQGLKVNVASITFLLLKFPECLKLNDKFPAFLLWPFFYNCKWAVAAARDVIWHYSRNVEGTRHWLSIAMTKIAHKRDQRVDRLCPLASFIHSFINSFILTLSRLLLVIDWELVHSLPVDWDQLRSTGRAWTNWALQH